MSGIFSPVTERFSGPNPGLGSRILISLGVVLLVTAMPAVVSAQDQEERIAAPDEAEQVVCRIETVADRSESAIARGQSESVSVIALCSGAGIVLGDADRFEVFENSRLGVLALAIERLGRTRIMLLARDAEGNVFAEDISGDLAAAAGRSPSAGLRGVAVDFARFGDDASIGVSLMAADARGTGARPRQFGTTEHLTQSRAYRTAERLQQVGEAQ